MAVKTWGQLLRHCCYGHHILYNDYILYDCEWACAKGNVLPLLQITTHHRSVQLDLPNTTQGHSTYCMFRCPDVIELRDGLARQTAHHYVDVIYLLSLSSAVLSM